MEEDFVVFRVTGSQFVSVWWCDTQKAEWRGKESVFEEHCWVSEPNFSCDSVYLAVLLMISKLMFGYMSPNTS